MATMSNWKLHRQPTRRSSTERLSRLVGVPLAVLSSACTPESPDNSPSLEDAIFIEDMGALHVYKTFEEPLCAGDRRRIAEQWDSLPSFLGVEPPESYLILYDYDQSDELNSRCGKNFDVAGCAADWGAYSTPAAASHELAHVLVRAETGSAFPPALLQEGLAEALEGTSISLFGDQLDIDIGTLLSSADLSSQLYRDDAHHVVSWLIDRHGIDAVLGAFIASDGIAPDDHAAFAATFGYSSIESMQGDYEQTSAFEYPARPDLENWVGEEELAQGVDLTPSCLSTHTVTTVAGTRTSIGFEIAAAGRFSIEYVGLTAAEFEPQRVWTTARFDTLPEFYDPVDVWTGYACFHDPGFYRIAFERQSGDEAPVFVRLGSEEGPGCE